MYPSLSEHQAWAQRASITSSSQQRSGNSHTAREMSSSNGPSIYTHHHQQSNGTSRSRRPRSNQYATGFLNCAYWPNRAVLDGHAPSSLNPNQITHLFYSHATVNYDGTIMLSDEKADLEVDVDGCKGGLRACMQLKMQNPRLKVILCLGGDASARAFPFLVSEEHLDVRRTFVYELRQVIQRFQLDGIEINWEAHNRAEGEALVGVMAVIRAALPRVEGHILSTSLPGTTALLEHIDITPLHEFVDYVTLRTYDWPLTSARSAHNTRILATTVQDSPEDVGSCQSTVDYLVSRKFPVSKILLGISCLGRAFVGTTGPGEPFLSTSLIPCRQLPIPSAEEYHDEDDQGAFCTDGKTWVTYDNAMTVQKKVHFVKMRSLRGLIFWDATADRKGSQSLVATGYEGLRHS